MEFGRFSKTMADVVAAVGGGASTPLQVAGELGIGNDDAGKYLRRLARRGLVVKRHRGLYAPAEAS